jgi:hypothetical protein
MSDTVSLIAGVLLTSVGLLALLPYVLKRGWRQQTGNLAVDSGYASVLAAVDAFEGSDRTAEETSTAPEDMEELLAQLFSLRMTVSDIAADIQETHEAIGGDIRTPQVLSEEIA